MLAVESVRDQLLFGVKLVHNPVSVLLHARCEDDHLVELGHLSEELMAERSDQEIGLLIVTIVDVVNQSLIQVEDESVFTL